MVHEMLGDLLQSKANVIAHQVNCKGVMGRGIALQIRNQLLSDQQFNSYRDLCYKYGAKLLGGIQYLQIPDGRVVVNLFAQDGYSARRQQTNYQALRHAFLCLRKFCIQNDYCHIAVPGFIGCGLAGGDWDYVRNQILFPLFINHEQLTLDIIYHPAHEEEYRAYAGIE